MNNPILDKKSGHDWFDFLNVSLGKGERAAKIIRGAAITASGISAYKTIKNYAYGKLTYTLKIESYDDVYEDLHAWVIDKMPENKLRSLNINALRARDAIEDMVSLSREERRRAKRRQKVRLIAFYNGDTTIKTHLNGHRIHIQVQVEDPKGPNAYEKKFMVFTAFSLEGKNAVLDLIRELAERHIRAKSTPMCYIANDYGNWLRQESYRGRDIGTVVLKKGQLEDIVSDIEKFLEDENLYSSIGVPYHRGYLFTGPPGTGKTSICGALATYFDMDLYILSPSDIKKDTDVLSMFSSIPENSILVIEDIDVAHAAKERSDEKAGLTLSGLLNALDGFLTPDKFIAFMTTNNPGDLQKALVREGRVDRVFHLDEVDQYQVLGISRLAFPDIRADQIPDFTGSNIIPAKIVEAIKVSGLNQEAYLLALKNLSQEISK